MAIESEIATRRKGDERGVVFFFFAGSLFGARFFPSPLLPTFRASTYVTIRAGLIDDFTRTLPRRLRNLATISRRIFSPIFAISLNFPLPADFSFFRRGQEFPVFGESGWRIFEKERSSSPESVFCARDGRRIWRKNGNPVGIVERWGIARKRLERVKVPALYEFLALGVWIGGPRLVSRSLVPPPPNGVDPRVRWIAWPAQLAAPKTLGCARRSLRLLRAPCVRRACVRAFVLFLPCSSRLAASESPTVSRRHCLLFKNPVPAMSRVRGDHRRSGSRFWTGLRPK